MCLVSCLWQRMLHGKVKMFDVIFKKMGEESTRVLELMWRVLVCLTDGFLLLQNFSVAISVSPHVCFILVLILISMFLR